jgi:hypothetical protein
MEVDFDGARQPLAKCENTELRRIWHSMGFCTQEYHSSAFVISTLYCDEVMDY